MRITIRVVLLLTLSVALLGLLPACTAKVSVGSTAGQSDTPSTTSTETKDKGTEAPSDTKAKVVSLSAGDQRDEGTKEITNATTTFGVKTKKMYVNAAITGLQKDAKITGTLRAVDVVTSEGSKVRDSDVVAAEVKAPGETSTATFDFTAPPNGWPVGTYVVKVAADGQQLDTIDLTVKASE